MGLQADQALCREATNLFWLGDPKDHPDPDLAAVRESMGLPVDKAILHPGHPAALAFQRLFAGTPFVLAPKRANQRSSVLNGGVPVFLQFQEMFGETFVAARANERPS